MNNAPYGYCECECGEKTELCPYTARSIGWIKGQPKRFIHGHQSRRPGPKYEERDLGYTTPCWLFLGYVGYKGYGSLRAHGAKNMRAAHIIYYEAIKGRVPAGKQLDHLCHTHDLSCPGGACIHRRCVNPDHLEPTTNTENQRRGRKPKLTIEQVRDIRSRPRTYGSRLALAREFNVDPATITVIRNHPDRHWIDPVS